MDPSTWTWRIILHNKTLTKRIILMMETEKHIQLENPIYETKTPYTNEQRMRDLRCIEWLRERERRRQGSTESRQQSNAD